MTLQMFEFEWAILGTVITSNNFRYSITAEEVVDEVVDDNLMTSGFFLNLNKSEPIICHGYFGKGVGIKDSRRRSASLAQVRHFSTTSATCLEIPDHQTDDLAPD